MLVLLLLLLLVLVLVLEKPPSAFAGRVAMFRCRQALAAMQAKGALWGALPPHPRPLSPVGGEGRILCFCVLSKRAVAPLAP
ncbi:MAG TPA: hypothetical protein DC058_00885, partial [Planctomycetaceae bacterium]|nr:hypothetical protein [Planctomycetaceae bacterium]